MAYKISGNTCKPIPYSVDNEPNWVIVTLSLQSPLVRGSDGRRALGAGPCVGEAEVLVDGETRKIAVHT